MCEVAIFHRHHLDLRVKYINGTYALDLTDALNVTLNLFNACNYQKF